MNDKKVIWITGASSGIGKALSIKFAQEGWIVAASARREGLLQELTKINQNIHSFHWMLLILNNVKKFLKNIIKNLTT